MEEIKESIADMRQLFLTRMENFTAELQKSPSTSAPSISSLATDFYNFKSFILTALQALQGQVELLDRKTEQLEMHSRRKMLLLHGVVEEKQESTEAAVVKVVVDKLKLLDFSINDISRCQRMGKPFTSGKSRPILFKLRDITVRSKIWFAKTQLKASGITLSEFLTKSRHDTFMAARSKYGVSKCWTLGGFVYVMGANGTRHRVSCISELNKIDGQVKLAVSVAAKEKTAPKSRRAASTLKK